MRTKLVILLILLLTPVAAPQASESPPPLRIVEVLAVPDATVGQREFIELLNPTNARIPLAGWRIEDAATAGGSINGFTFGNEFLEPGARIVVWSNGTADARGPSWSTSPSKTVWNDAGDAATLLDPAGQTMDWFAYGNSAAAAPEGFSNASRPPAPAKGLSVAVSGENWTEGAPTPGLGPDEVGGVAGATVQNIPPSVSMTGPQAAKPGDTLQLTLRIDDDNGPSDIATWSLRAGLTVLASGNSTGQVPVSIKAPATSGPWVIELSASDRAGAVSRSNITFQVRDARFAVELPATGGIRFPPLAPGQHNVTSLEPFIVRNQGNDAAPILLDVSPFRGPGTIPVDGNLWIGFAIGNATPTWERYAKPLQPLPAIAPGIAWSVWLRIDQVPTPLPAGSYGTSFTVVAG